MTGRWRVVIVLGDAAGAGRSGPWRFKRDIAREIPDRTGGAVVVVGAPGSGLFSWKSVRAGADSEDDANHLAEKIQQYAPSDAEVHAERADTPIYSGEDRASGPLDYPFW